MASALLRIEQAGPLTTIQDLGRPGWARYGVPRSGPVDGLSFAAANAALGNTPDRAAVEFSLGGLIISCLEGAIGFALTGAGTVAAGEGYLGGSWLAGDLCAGDRLAIRTGPDGNWGYLALRGVLPAARWLGSQATHAPSGLGGGRLQAGRELRVDDARVLGEPRRLGRFDAAAGLDVVRVVPGPQDRFFEPAIRERLFTETFALTAAMDRMGAVLAGPKLPPTRLDMLSEPATRGCLQVDGTGRVTLLLSDHQTTGGYPKIGAVLLSDVDRLAQLSPGRAFRFSPITPGVAVLAHRQMHERRMEYLQALGRAETLQDRLWTANLIGGVASATD